MGDYYPLSRPYETVPNREFLEKSKLTTAFSMRNIGGDFVGSSTEISTKYRFMEVLGLARVSYLYML